MKATNSSAFFNYIIYDSLIIIFLLINNLLLIINGLWEQREQEIESIYHAMERVIKTKDLSNDDIPNLKEFNSHFLEKERKGTLQIIRHEPKPLQWILKLIKVLKKNKKNEYGVENKIEKEKNLEEKIKNILLAYTNNEKNKKYFQYLFPWE